MRVVSYIFGLGAMLSLFLLYQQKSRRGILYSKLSADVCWVLHYLCLGATAGMIPNGIGVFRELIFVNRKNKKWAGGFVWPCVFILINWCLSIATFDAYYDILPVLGSTFVTVALWLDNPILG